MFANLIQLRVGRAHHRPRSVLYGRSEQLAALALHHAVPAVYKSREFAAAGGLMSYGADITDAYRFAGVYTGRILKGEKPASCRYSRPRKSSCT